MIREHPNPLDLWSAARLCLGAAALLVAAMTVGTSSADGRGDFAGDPTVGTLPIVTGTTPELPGPDQVLYLRGDATRLRAVLGAAEMTGPQGQGGLAVFELPGGEAWVEFHGDFLVTWADPSVLQGIELGIGAGFEGGGMHLVVETYAGRSTPSTLDVGRTLEIEPMRLQDAGLLARPVLVHGLHASGARTSLVLDTQGGAFTIRQQV